MKSMPKDSANPRFLDDQAELVERIERGQPSDGSREASPGLFFNRLSVPHELVHSLVEPSLCVIAQGSKEIMLGEERFRYDAAHYLISTMQLPVSAEVVEASPQRPYLSFRLVLDPSVVTALMVESEYIPAKNECSAKAVAVSPLDADLLNTALRLVRLVDEPDQYRVLAPLVQREIVYRLLRGEQGERLSHLARFSGQAHRMVRAVEKIRSDYSKPLRIEDIARELHMSVSGFHAHFKSATAMSPLQFQKKLRLQEARRLMLSEALDAAEAGYRVGYDDASHFSREYKKHFGQPPIRDIERLRTQASA